MRNNVCDTKEIVSMNILTFIENTAAILELVFFILMLAYAMAETFMASGVGASIIIMSLNILL